MDRLVRLLLDRRISDAQFNRQKQELDEKAKGLSREKAEIDSQLSTISKTDLTLDLIHTLRVLSSSAKRFTEAQRTKIFRLAR